MHAGRHLYWADQEQGSFCRVFEDICHRGTDKTWVWWVEYSSSECYLTVLVFFLFIFIPLLCFLIVLPILCCPWPYFVLVSRRDLGLEDMPISNKIRVSPYRRCLRFVGSFFIEQIDRVLRFFWTKTFGVLVQTICQLSHRDFFLGWKKSEYFRLYCVTSSWQVNRTTSPYAN